MTFAQDGVWDNEFNSRAPMETNPAPTEPWAPSISRTFSGSPTRTAGESQESIVDGSLAREKIEGSSPHDESVSSSGLDGSTAATTLGEEPPLIQAGFDEGVLRSLTGLDVRVLYYLSITIAVLSSAQQCGVPLLLDRIKQSMVSCRVRPHFHFIFSSAPHPLHRRHRSF